MTRAHARPRWLDLAVALLLALLIRHYADALGVRDDAQGAFLNFIITGVAAAFGWLADKAVTVAVVVWHATRIVGTALVRFGIGLGGILGKVYGLLGSFWRSVLRPLIQYTWSRIDQLTAWLRHTLAPAFRFLELVRRRLWAIYDRYFRPIFDTIELTRRILQLLATFRLEWARELDRKLAELEDRLLYPIREAMLWLNRAMDVLNRIVTLDGLLQRVTLMRSIVRDMALVQNAWHNMSSKPLTDEERRVDVSAPGFKQPAQIVNDFRAYLRTGDGPHRASIDEWLQELRRRLASV